MAEVGLQEVDTNLPHHHNTVEQFISTRPIMDMCLVAEQRTGSRVTNRWCEQDGLDVEGMRMATQEAERTEGGEETDRAETETD